MATSIRDEAIKLHLDNKGKLATKLKVPLENGQHLALAYTPGVAEPCKEIKANEDLSFELTLRGNSVAIITDGTRVLGLGPIGASQIVKSGLRSLAFGIAGSAVAILILLGLSLLLGPVSTLWQALGCCLLAGVPALLVTFGLAVAVKVPLA